MTLIQTRINGINDTLSKTLTPEIKNQLLKELLSATGDANAIYDNTTTGIENSEKKEQSAKHKKIAEEQLAEATILASSLSPSDTTFETALKGSYNKTLLSIAELDSAFAIVNPCPEKGKEELYTDSNGQRQINLSMVNRFKLVWNEANAPLTYDNYTYKTKERELFKWTNFSQLWANYRFAQDEKRDTSVGNGSPSGLATNPLVAATTETDKDNYRFGEYRTSGGEGGKGGKIKSLDSDKSSDSEPNRKANTSNRPVQGAEHKEQTLQAREANKDGSRSNISESDKKIAAYSSGSLSADFFTVQIAANTKPLDIKLLKLLYKGSYIIEERLEDGWYRYVVGRFFDVNAAVSHLNVSIEVGMVTAYKGNARTIVKTKSHETQSLSTQEGLIAVYRVQIAAAKKPIPAKVLHSLHSGIRPINVYAEDGWFRYSIGDYLLYSDAILVRDSCGIPGAFVMPYINGVRQPLKGRQAVQREEVKRISNPVFVVQLAATKRPISLRKLKTYRKEGIPVTLHIEDGWYKYTAYVYFNKDLARKTAVEMKVSGAFVVTYINGKRVK